MNIPMRRIRLLIVLAFGLTSLFATVTPAGAQREPVLPSSLCEASFSEAAAQACANYDLCHLAPEAYWECEAQIVADMLSQCAVPICEPAWLFNLAVIVTAMHYSFDRGGTPMFYDTMTGVLNDYAGENYEAAAAALLDLFVEYEHRYLPYSAALAYEATGMRDEALIQYARAAQVEFFTPLVYYSRGYLHAARIDPQRAAMDFYTFSALITDEDPLAVLTVPEADGDDLLADSETWAQYPLLRYGSGPGGDFVTDRLSEPPHQFDLAWLNDDETLAVRGFLAEQAVYGVPVPEILFFECEAVVCTLDLHFQQTFAGLSAGGDSIDFEFDNDYAQIVVTSNGAESSGIDYALMLPADADDPRPDVPCEGGVYPRLAVGDEVNPQTWWMTIAVYAEPDPDSALLAEYERPVPRVEITGDLVCGEGGNWWPVSIADGTIGWVPEAGEYGYQLTTEALDREMTIDELLDWLLD
jgi:hypothetical protein